MAVFRDQNRNGLSDRLFCSVVEDALRSPIPAGDAIEVFAYDCVIAIFNNRCERTQSKKDDKGVWRGIAMRDGNSVDVSLDFEGNIVAKCDFRKRDQTSFYWCSQLSKASGQ